MVKLTISTFIAKAVFIIANVLLKEMWFIWYLPQFSITHHRYDNK